MGIMFAIFYFLLIRPQQKQQKDHKTMVANLRRGDKVVTAGGIIGTVAKANPWETLHKIRMGQPLVQMISMLAFDVQDHVDILAYAQTLPEK